MRNARKGRWEPDPVTLQRHVEDFGDVRVLVVGDIILDEYVWGEVSRISPEAPVPVVEVKNETKLLGGAANVVNNMASLGAKPFLCGVVGDDEEGDNVAQKIRELDLSSDGIIREKGRITTKKTRIVAHNQQVVRFDREIRSPISVDSTRAIIKAVEREIPHCSAVVVSDYCKGVVSAQLMEALLKAASVRKVPVAVDPKPPNFSLYSGVTVITPNHHEAAAFCGFSVGNSDSLIKAGRKMLRDLKCSAVLVTQGKDGMTLFERRGSVIHVPTVAKKVFDVTGAGDTAIAVFTLGMASGLDLRSAAVISNFAAGIVVGEVGTTAVRTEELKAAILSKP